MPHEGSIYPLNSTKNLKSAIKNWLSQMFYYRMNYRAASSNPFVRWACAGASVCPLRDPLVNLAPYPGVVEIQKVMGLWSLYKHLATFFSRIWRQRRRLVLVSHHVLGDHLGDHLRQRNLHPLDLHRWPARPGSLPSLISFTLVGWSLKLDVTSF